MTEVTHSLKRMNEGNAYCMSAIIIISSNDDDIFLWSKRHAMLDPFMRTKSKKLLLFAELSQVDNQVVSCIRCEVETYSYCVPP